MYIHDKYLVSIICYLLYSFCHNDNVFKMNKGKERGRDHYCSPWNGN